jgi:hypothetical protein
MSDPHWLAMLIGIVAAALLLTGLLLKAALGKGHPKGKMCQLAAAYRRFSPGVPGRDRRLRLKLLVLLVLVILNVVVLGFLLSRAPGERAVESTSTQIATPGGVSSSAGRSAASELGAVRRMGRPFSWRIWPTPRPFQAIRIQGTYQGGAETFLRVQRWEGGKCLAFPLPTKTDQSGRFTTHVEFDQPGRYHACWTPTPV